MSHLQHRFHTNGSNALKPDTVEFDVFVKPQFSADYPTSIVDFRSARNGVISSIELPESDPNFSYCELDDRSIFQRITHRIEHDRLLGDLFKLQKANRYGKGDLSIFAKGFSLTGLATFVMILFGA